MSSSRPGFVRRVARFLKRRIRRSVVWAARPWVDRQLRRDRPDALVVQDLSLRLEDVRRQSERREKETVRLGQRLADLEDDDLSRRLDAIEELLRKRGILK